MKAPETLPKISQPLLRFFGRYATGYLRRHFHTVRLLEKTAEIPSGAVDVSLCETRGSAASQIGSVSVAVTRASHSEAATGGRPLVVSLNHAAWWDPLVCLFLWRTFFPTRYAYGPMDASAVARYGFFKRLGFFPVETGTARGATQFLRTSEAILAQPESVLFLTPQGKFADVRAPLVLESGLEHLAARAPQARFVALAIEYTFWEERKPEILLAFGDDLAAAQARLAAAAQRRQPNEWTILLRARSGASWPYDFWRGLRARWRGERFTREHSQL